MRPLPEIVICHLHRNRTHLHGVQAKAHGNRLAERHQAPAGVLAVSHIFRGGYAAAVAFIPGIPLGQRRGFHPVGIVPDDAAGQPHVPHQPVPVHGRQLPDSVDAVFRQLLFRAAPH